MDQIPSELIGRAVQDRDFRRRFLEDPRRVASDEGYELDDEQIAVLREMDPEAIDDAIAALMEDQHGAKWG
jgi:hypothetical protein